jgi:hypothetical protein
MNVREDKLVLLDELIIAHHIISLSPEHIQQYAIHLTNQFFSKNILPKDNNDDNEQFKEMASEYEKILHKLQLAMVKMRKINSVERQHYYFDKLIQLFSLDKEDFIQFINTIQSSTDKLPPRKSETSDGFFHDRSKYQSRVGDEAAHSRKVIHKQSRPESISKRNAIIKKIKSGELTLQDLNNHLLSITRPYSLARNHYQIARHDNNSNKSNNHAHDLYIKLQLEHKQIFQYLKSWHEYAMENKWEEGISENEHIREIVTFLRNIMELLYYDKQLFQIEHGYSHGMFNNTNSKSVKFVDELFPKSKSPYTIHS